VGMRLSLVLSCEHASRAVPRHLSRAFDGRSAWLLGHRGWDPGAEGVGRALGQALGVPLIAGTVSRLVVDLNRPEGHPRVFSEVTRTLPPAEREALLAGLHRPHWDRVREAIASAPPRTTVLHLGIHSFSPELDPPRRDFDLGLLYDPGREGERPMADRLAAALRAEDPSMRLRRNAPYRGASEGLTTSLRRELPPRRYLGFELELSQAWAVHAGPARRRMTGAVVRAVRRVLEG